MFNTETPIDLHFIIGSKDTSVSNNSQFGLYLNHNEGFFTLQYMDNLDALMFPYREVTLTLKTYTMRKGGRTSALVDINQLDMLTSR